jgi:hypothetical protein
MLRHQALSPRVVRASPLSIVVGALSRKLSRFNLFFAVGVAKANEVLLWGKKATAPELQASGFIK